VVDRRVAVGMEVAHHLADDLRALAVRAVRAEPHRAHAVQHAAMRGLQSIAHVWQRSPDDYAHRVIHVRALHLVLDVYGDFRSGNVSHRTGEMDPLPEMDPLAESDPLDELDPLCVQMSRFLTSSALSSMNLRRGSTWSPISVVNIRSASVWSSAFTCSRVRLAGSIVVSHNVSGFISPRPLYRFTARPRRPGATKYSTRSSS